jgi:hypothetical protein
MADHFRRYARCFGGLPDIHPIPRCFLILQDIGTVRRYSKSLLGKYYTIIRLKNFDG